MNRQNYKNYYYNCNYCDRYQDYYCHPTWIKGDVGPVGPQGPQGQIGPTGPEAPQSFVQLFDRNYTNELYNTDTNLNLSNEGIDPIFSTGEYTLTTTTVKNDTLNLPGPGLYHISISLSASFLQPNNPGDTFGKDYKIIFDILDKNNSIITQLHYVGIIPKDENAFIEAQLSTQFLYNAEGNTPTLKVALTNFNFNLAFLKELGVNDIIFIVQRWRKN